MRPFFVLTCYLLCISFIPYPDVKKIQINGTAQGTTYHITYYANDSLVKKHEIDNLLSEIDSSLSLYKSYSLINKFNESMDGIRVDKHMMRVVNKALEVFGATDGLFDITVYPLTEAWGFGPHKTQSIPDSNAIGNILPCVGSRMVYWKGKELVKKRPCLRLDPNGIAQGYSVDLLAMLMEQKGINNYLVELGGEIRVRGRKWPGGAKMSIGIEAPADDADNIMLEKTIWLDKGGITTSGNYRRYYESNGKRISHLINPLTGFPISNELISVTVYAPDAMTADAYDNALMAMGLKKAMAFVEKRKDISAYFIYRMTDGTVADTMSKGFRSLLQP